MDTRRDFLKKSIGGLAGAVSSFYIGGCSKSSQKENVILVTMDTARYKDINSINSPNLIRFGDEGLFFEKCYSSGHQTIPSHASILTGKYPHNHEVLTQWDYLIKSQTLADILSKEGYNTCGVTSANFLNKHSLGKGFNYFLVPRKNPFRTSKETFNVARDYLEFASNHENPYFLWIHLWDPHHPYNLGLSSLNLNSKEERVLNDLKDKFPRLVVPHKEKGRIGRGTELNEEEQELVRKLYSQEIKYMDENLGDFFKFLKKVNQYDNSTIVLTSDHGESLFENTNHIEGHNLLDEPVVRIPLLIKNPHLKPQRRTDLVQNIDIVPTILSLIGKEYEKFDGGNLIQNQSREEIYLTHSRNRVFSIVNKEGKKFTRNFFPKIGRWEIPKDWEFVGEDINLLDGDLENLIYSPDNLGFSLDFNLPKNHEDIVEYIRQSYSENKQSNSKGNCFHFDEKGHYFDISQSKRQLSFVIAPLGQIPYRIVGVDSEGQIVASSNVEFAGAKIEVAEECFDLLTDPNETNSLNNPSWKSNLEKKLTSFANKSKRFFEEEKEISIDKETQEHLEALGYI
jgi:arylsulfatase A-like enzyme